MDKAITGFIMSLLSLFALAGWWNVQLDEAHVLGIVGAALAIFGGIYAVPNKTTAVLLWCIVLPQIATRLTT